MANYSPYGGTPVPPEYTKDYPYDKFDKFPSPSPTPSPRGPAYYYQPPPPRPATRAHFRNTSTSGIASPYASPRIPSFSPRYTSDGQYATVNVSASRTRKASFSGLPRPPRERRSSFTYHASVSHGESDEDEFIDLGGSHTFVIPGRGRSRSIRDPFNNIASGHGTDHGYYAQGGPSPFFDRDGFASPRYDPDRRPPPPPPGATPGPVPRRNSTSIPQRPQTARPTTTPRKPPAPQPARQATEADAKKHRIPPGYSLKNWDPTEEPIMLLGSVFDANSLGKWIYDWTVYHHGAGSPIADNAGELWLLLIQLSGKIKRAEEIVPKIRSRDNREMVEEFIEAGERITDKLRKLLKACEAPMLRSAKQKKEGQLGKSAGVEFGADRELEKTQKFMASVRLWNLRFDTNCEEILRKPTM
jgi:hypothetical protein